MSSVINPSFYRRCAKEFQLKGSTKIKKKKGKDKAKNNNSTVNEAFEADDDEKHSSQNRSSLTPLLESGDLKKGKTRSIHFTEKRTDVMTGVRKGQKGSDIERGNGRVSATHEEELSRRNSSCLNEGRQRKFSRHGSLVSSMIYDLQREDTFIEKTLTTETPSSGGSVSRVHGARFKRQVTSTSVSVSVVTSKGVQKEKAPTGEDRVRRIGDENNDLKAAKGEKGKQNDGNTTQNSNWSFADQESEKETTCCFQWQPSSSNNRVKKVEEESEETGAEKTGTLERSNNTEKNEKVGFLLRMKTKVTKRKVMAVTCPCFTYFILEGDHGGNPFDKEKGESDKNQQEIR